MSIMNDLHAVGLNPFGVQLVAESLLKSPLAPMSAAEPVTMFFPVQRSDCAGWAGREPISTPAGAAALARLAGQSEPMGLVL